MWSSFPNDPPTAPLRVAFDIEFVIQGERVVPFELGACLVDDNTTSFHRVIWPDVTDLPACPTLPELSWDWLRENEAVPLRQAMYELHCFLATWSADHAGVLLCAHNASVADAPLLSRMSADAGVPLQALVFDTLPFLRYAFRGAVDSFSMDSLVQRALGATPAHRAHSDATQLAALLTHAEIVRGAPLAGMAVHLGGSPITLAPGIGSGTAQALAALGVPLEASSLVLHLRLSGWPDGVSRLVREKLQAFLRNHCGEPHALARLVRGINCELIAP